MKRLFPTCITAVLSLLASSLSIAGESHAVSIEKSSIQWTGTKVGGSHTGNLSLKSGHLEFKGDALSGGSFVLNMASIDTTDLSGGKKDKLDGHLKSPDFFDVEKHPTASFKITKVQPSSKPDAVKVLGILTIKGISEEIGFDATIQRQKGKPIAATGNITFDRSKFDIQFRSGSFFENLGDKLIYDDIGLKVTLALN